MPILNGFPQGGGDGKFLPLTGGTMSGSIAMGSNKLTGLANGTATGDAVNLGQLNGKLSTSGGTMSGALNMGSKKITNLAAGTSSTDAANLGQLKDAGKFKGILVSNGSSSYGGYTLYFTPTGVMVCQYSSESTNVSGEAIVNIKQMMFDAYPWFSSITSMEYKTIYDVAISTGVSQSLTIHYAQVRIVFSGTNNANNATIYTYNRNGNAFSERISVPFFLPLVRINQ